MKKIITALVIILSPIAAQAISFTEKTYKIGETNQVVGGSKTLDIRWDDFNQFFEISQPILNTGSEYPNAAFYGIRSDGSLSDYAMAGWNWDQGGLTISNYDGDEGGYQYGWKAPKVGSYNGYVGMRLVVATEQYTNNVFQLDESQLKLVSKQEYISQSCEGDNCSWDYMPGMLDLNDIRILGLDEYTISYSHRDASASNVPEPASLGMVGLAIAGGLIVRRKKKA